MSCPDYHPTPRCKAPRVHLAQTFYGLCFSPDGKSLYASGAEYETVHRFRFEEGLLGRRVWVHEADYRRLGLADDLADAVLVAPTAVVNADEEEEEEEETTPSRGRK